jgi:hypothetical protein
MAIKTNSPVVFNGKNRRLSKYAKERKTLKTYENGSINVVRVQANNL